MGDLITTPQSVHLIKANCPGEEIELFNNKLTAVLTRSVNTFNKVQISVVKGSKRVYKLKHDYEQICARMFGKPRFFKPIHPWTIQTISILPFIPLLSLACKWSQMIPDWEAETRVRGQATKRAWFYILVSYKNCQCCQIGTPLNK